MDNNKQNNATVETWQGQLLYIQLINRLYAEIVSALDIKDIRTALSKEELLLATIEPTIKTRYKNKDYSPEYEKTINDIRSANDLLIRANRIRNENDNHTKNLILEQAFNKAMQIFVMLGNYMMTNHLIFKQGISSEDIWIDG